MEPSNVLVPLDGSALAEAALEHALETYDCEFTVLNVVTTIDTGMSESGVLDATDERTETAQRRADRLVEEAKTRAASAHGRTVDTVVASGEPADTILTYVEEHDVDMVVMGGHGDDGGALAARLLGTVATRVVREAPVSVTVIR